jgi:hypothetical protein
MLFVPPTIETAGVQLRFVLETIAFSSLVANQPAYASVYADFSKDWNAAKLLKKIERVNPDFYPVPQVLERSRRPDIRIEVSPLAADRFLAKADFPEAYGRLGGLAHATNPYHRNPPDYDQLRSDFADLAAKIRCLLRVHTIHLTGSPALYLVQLNEPVTRNVVYTPLFKEA